MYSTTYLVQMAYLVPKIERDRVTTSHQTFNVVPPENWYIQNISRTHDSFLTSGLCKLREPCEVWSVEIHLHKYTVDNYLNKNRKHLERTHFFGNTKLWATWQLLNSRKQIKKTDDKLSYSKSKYLKCTKWISKENKEKLNFN